MSKLNEKNHEGKMPKLDIFGSQDFPGFHPPAFMLQASLAGTPFGQQPWVDTSKKSPLMSKFGGNYEPYTFTNEFPWQNPDIRKVLYPTRTEKLVDFLNTVGVDFVASRNYDDPNDETAAAIRAEATVAHGQAEQQYVDAAGTHASLKTQVKDLGKDIGSNRKTLIAERKAEKKGLKEAGLVPLGKEVAALEEEIAKLTKQAKTYESYGVAAQKRLKKEEITQEEYEKKAANYKDKQTKAEEECAEKTKEYETKKKSYDIQAASVQANGNQTEYRIGQLEKEREEKSALVGPAKAEEDFYKALERELASIAKAKTIGAEEVRDWAVFNYKNKVKSLGSDNIANHDQVLGAVLELFNEDSEMAKTPEWLRYATIHFTGLTYESAHGTWADPQNLLKIIEEQNIRDASPEEIAEMMNTAKTDISAKLAEAQKAGNEKDIKRYTAQLAKIDAGASTELSGDSLIPSSVKGDRRGAYEQLVEKERKRAELNRKVSTGKGTAEEAKELKALEIDIPTFVKENKIPGSMHIGIRNKMADHREEALSGLMDYSNDTIDKMDESEVLGVLKSMKDEIQDVGKDDYGYSKADSKDIWKEIAAFTQLRNDEASGDDWMSEYPERYQLKKATSDDPETQRWLNILNEWRSGDKHKTDVTIWRAKFRDELKFVATSLVCNELAEHIQYLQGNSQRGGLNRNAVDYHKAAKQESSGAYFKHPTSKSDFVPGASIFFAEWRTDKPSGANTVDLAALDGETFYAPLTHEYKDSEDYKFAEQKWYRDKILKTEKKEAEQAIISKFPPDAKKKSLDTAEQKIFDKTWNESVEKRIADSKQKWMKAKAEEHALHKPVPIPAIGGSSSMDGWEYSFEGNILIKQKEGVKLYLRWGHQSTVVDADEKRVRAYNTSGNNISGMGITDHYTYSELTNNKNIYVGFSKGHKVAGLEEAITFEDGQYASGKDMFAY